MEEIRSKYLSILDVLFLLSLILCANSVYFVSASADSQYCIWAIPICSILLIIGYFWVLTKEKRNIDFKMFTKVLIWYLVLITIFLFFNYLNFRFNLINIMSYYYIIPILFFMVCLLVFSANRAKGLINSFINIIFLLSIVSCFFWVLAEIGVPRNCSMFINWGGIRDISGYFGVEYFTQGIVPFLKMHIIRNTGIFAEGPMFSFAVSLAFIFELFYFQDKRLFKTKLAIFLITIFTTATSTGIIVVAAAIVGYFVKKYFRYFLNLSRKHKVMIIAGGSCVILLFLAVILLNKMRTAQGSQGSVSVRTNDLMAGIQAFLQHPIIGNGLGNYSSLQRFFSASRLEPGGNGGYSLGLCQIMAYGGIYLLVIYLIPLITCICKKNLTDVFVMLLLLLLLALTIVNEMPLFIFILIFMFYKQLFSKNKSVNWTMRRKR